MTTAQQVKAQRKSEQLWHDVGWNYSIESCRKDHNITHETAWNYSWRHVMYLNNISNAMK